MDHADGDDPTPAGGATDGAVEAVRTYYRALDDGDYDRLAGVLADGFVQHRPDRTFEGREAFVRFMRENRPRTDTTHDLAGLYRSDEGVVAEGRLLDDGGDSLFAFADVHDVADGRIVELRTYTR